MKNLIQISISVLIVLSNSCYSQLFSRKIHVLNTKLSEKKIAGNEGFRAGSTGIKFIFDDGGGYKINYIEDITPQEVACQIVGKSYPESDLKGDLLQACDGNSNVSPFPCNKIVRSGQDAHKIDYSETKKVNIDVSATVKADLSEISKVIKDQNILSKVSASLTAAYSKLSGSEVTLGLEYHQYQLHTDELDAFLKDLNYKQCREWMTPSSDPGSKHGSQRCVTAVGFIKFIISYKDNSIESILSELQAKLDAEGIPVNIGFQVRRELNRQFSNLVKGGYQIVMWRTIGIDDLKAQKVLKTD